MSAAKKKKKLDSLYDQFYGASHQQKVNKTIRSIEEQIADYVSKIQTKVENHISPTSHTMTQRSDLDKLRDTIRKGAKGNMSKSYTKQPSRKPQIPVINNVVKVKEIQEFTNQTHRVEVGLKPANYYNEQITTKIVGMEVVDWWEYVLIYGFFKSLKIGFEYSKMKDYIEKGVQTTRTVSGQNLQIKFIPKKKNDVKQTPDTLNGQTVIRESGTVYESAVLNFEVPQKSKQGTQEYQKGYFVYEDTFSTLVIDNDALNEQIDKMLVDSNVHPTLIEEIKQTLKNGRLSAI